MPLQATSGAASYDAFGGGVPFEPTYIEQIFATHLYTGNGSTQTITNGIDLAGKGGLVWTKSRSVATDHSLVDTARGADKVLHSESTAAQVTFADITAFNSNGYSISDVSGWVNTSPRTYVSWTFRKQPKFFDVVTYTGNGSDLRQIAHALDAVPGFIVVKRTDATSAGDGSSWAVWHRSASGSGYLNRTNALDSSFPNSIFWGGSSYVAPTSTNFTVSSAQQVNASGGTYVAYLFAHNAGGFGLTGTDNVISCGSYTGNGSSSGPTITLGYEPQWLMIKNATAAGFGWSIYDTMRGLDVGPGARWLQANTANAEVARGLDVGINSTGFQLLDSNNSVNGSGNTYIYIAIRRGPMRTPTTGTSVFAPVARTGTGATATVTAGFPIDMYLMQRRPTASFPNIVDRLRGNSRNLQTYQTDAELTTTNTVTGLDSMTGAVVGADTDGYVNQSGITYANQMFRRAPGFFDVVCYTGTGSNITVAHNLGVLPELIICKYRNGTVSGSDGNWHVFYDMQPTLFSRLYLNTTGSVVNAGYNSAAGLSGQPTAFNFYPDSKISASTVTYVAYLFASCPGVSKVGTYTGNGSSQTINMGFTGGARFFLVKRTDSTGDWWVYDSARGIVSAADPALRLNSTAAEVTSADAVDTDSTGLIVNQESTCNINVSSATYIYLGIS